MNSSCSSLAEKPCTSAMRGPSWTRNQSRPAASHSKNPAGAAARCLVNVRDIGAPSVLAAGTAAQFRESGQIAVLEYVGGGRVEHELGFIVDVAQAYQVRQFVAQHVDVCGFAFYGRLKKERFVE